MLVRESLDACVCDQCGTMCTGRFANCWRSIFQPNGRTVQLRCLPRNIPGARSITGSRTGNTRDRAHDDTLSDHDHDSDSYLAKQVAELKLQMAEVINALHDLGADNSRLEINLEEVMTRLDELARQSANGNHSTENGGERQERQLRPGKTVVHAEVLHRHHSEPITTPSDQIPPPVMENASGS